MRGLPNPRPRAWWSRALDGALLLAVVVCATTVAWRLALHCGVGGRWALVLAAAPVGLLAADFGSGAAHWWGDTFFSERTPFIGPALIRPFREHHRLPLEILRHDLLAVQRNNALVTLPVFATLAWLPLPESIGWFALYTALAWFALFGLVTNQLHHWTHHRRPPRLVRWLQRKRLILSPALHRRHHRRANRAFCVTTGWLNGWLDRRRVWHRLERLWRRATRAAA